MQIKHQHLVSASAIFFTNDPQEYMCVVSEYLVFCLDHLAVCSTRPSDLASMMGQVRLEDHFSCSFTNNSRF
jgi:hypothetical protein